MCKCLSELVLLLSHLHTDHSADLPAYVKGSYFTERNKDLWVIGPEGNTRMPSTSDFLQRLFGTNGAFPYLSDYLQAGQESYQLKAFDVPLDVSKASYSQSFEWGKVTALPVHHGPIPALAWRLETANCVVVYSGDMNNQSQRFAKFAQNADLLIVHMAIPEDAGIMAKNLHMSPAQIADIAQNVKPKKLLISHFMRRSEDVAAGWVAQLKQQIDAEIFIASRLQSIPVNGHDGAVK